LTLGFVRRNIKISNPQVKERSYKAVVGPELEYSQTVWDPHTSGAVKKVDAVQHRVTRYTLNRYIRTSSAKLAAFSRKMQNCKNCHVLQNVLQLCHGQHASDIEIL